MFHLGLPPKFHHLQSNGARWLLTAVTVLNCACTRAPSLHNNLSATDSITIHVNAKPYGHIDVFIYADTLTRALESHRRFQGGQTFLRMSAKAGDKIVAALSDVSREFKELPGTFDVMEKFTMSYADENPSAPLQSGTACGEAGRLLELSLTPLLCPISIGKIRIEADVPLEDAVVQLVNVNAQAEILRSDGFHPAQTLNGPETLEYPLMMLRELPSMIGSSPLPVGITLWCYPNEDEDSPGGRCTTLRIIGRIRGEMKEYHIPLGPIRRGTGRELDIELKE